MATSPLRILVTAAAAERFGHDIVAAGGAATELAVLSPEGTVTVEDRPVEEPPTVAYASPDLFDRSDPGRELLRGFFVSSLKNPALEWFHIAAAGVDDPVFAALLDKGVRLTTSHHTGVPISEYVLAQVLRARVPLDAMEADRRARRWANQRWDEVAASRWLVIGMGSIGTEVARRARAFGARVTGVRRTPRGDEPVDSLIGPADLLDVVGRHDVVVLAVPATADTVAMVDEELLGHLAPGTILVNVGRGSLVDEDALARSLADGRPARAILDVASTEPLPGDHWLWNHPDVVLTAHTSAGSRQVPHRASEVFCANLRRWVAGQPLADEVREHRDRPAPP